MLPREVTSMIPFPQLRAAAHKAANAAQDIVAPVGTIRASSPSPVGIECERPGQAPRRSEAFMALSLW